MALLFPKFYRCWSRLLMQNGASSVAKFPVLHRIAVALKRRDTESAAARNDRAFFRVPALAAASSWARAHGRALNSPSAPVISAL
jgi:hypothetical protein